MLNAALVGGQSAPPVTPPVGVFLRIFPRVPIVTIGNALEALTRRSGDAAQIVADYLHGSTLALNLLLRRSAPYLWSVVITCVAALVRAGLGTFLGVRYPLGTFYAAVAIIGWFWGVSPAVLAAVLGYLLGDYFFLTPRPPTFGTGSNALEPVVYAAICSALIALVYRVYERERRLDQALSDHASTRQALVDSDARFKRYLDALPDIVYTWKADGSMEYVNPRWADYVGGAENVSDEMVSANVPAEDLRELIERRNEALRRGEPLRAEFRLRDRHGWPRWFMTRCVPIRDAKNSITGWVGTSIDIDDEKRAAEALELSERRYRSVSEAVDFGMWSADNAGRLTFMSARYLDFLGVTQEQVGAQLWSAVQAPPEEIHEAAGRWERCKATGEPWESEYSVRGKDGAVRRVWSRGVALRGADGAVSSWAGFNLDVTERYAAAHAGDQARQRLEAVTNAMSIGVAQCNRQMEYVWANPAYARLMGGSPEQIDQFQGRRLEDVLGRAAFERLEPSFLRVLNGDSAEFEGQLESGIDPDPWIHARYTPIWNGDPAPIGWVAVINDLTERRALEQQLRDTNRRKDAFLATLAHELRNPLAPIRYATQLMKPGTPTEMAADARRMIERQLAHMARLLDDLLDVSRITRGTLEIRRDTLDLRAALQYAVDAARPLAEAVEQDIQVDLPSDPLPVSGDETRLIQVVGNIINNAIKFANPGGRIFVSAASDGAMVAVSVRDTGRGISQELLPNIFEMFVQGEPNSQSQSGLGIGLALAKQMIDLHGGRIEAHSDGPGRGSEFRVLLPRVAELPAMQDSVADAKVSVLGANNIRVLVVDDNVDAADSLALFLKIAGYQTRVAYDGRTAVEMAEILEPGVVLLDLGLPYLNGHEVARRLRVLPWGRTARLIALTGWGQEDDVLRSRQSGFDEHLTKPVDPEVLLQRIILLTRDQAQTGN
jgi:PAS domain S-box-containing protein